MCNISYIVDIIFYFILFFGILSFLLYFYVYNRFLSVNSLDKDLIIYMNIITIIHYFVILLLMIFWIIDVLFIGFRLRQRFDKNDLKKYEDNQKKELQFRKIDRDDIKL